MSVQLVTITEPVTEPVTTAEAKAHLRISFSEDDTYIDALVSAARKMIETLSGYRLFTQTVELRADNWLQATKVATSVQYGWQDVNRSDVVMLRVAPVQSIDSVKYYDADDVDQTMLSSLYWPDLLSRPARLQVKDTWPSTNERIGNIRVRMTAGWSDADDIPKNLKQAVLLLVGHYYENREEVSDINLKQIPVGITNLVLGSEYNHWNTGSL